MEPSGSIGSSLGHDLQNNSWSWVAVQMLERVASATHNVWLPQKNTLIQSYCNQKLRGCSESKTIDMAANETPVQVPLDVLLDMWTTVCVEQCTRRTMDYLTSRRFSTTSSKKSWAANVYTSPLFARIKGAWEISRRRTSFMIVS